MVRLQSGRMLFSPPQHGAWKPSCTCDTNDSCSHVKSCNSVI